jgi:hypothetical protein
MNKIIFALFCVLATGCGSSLHLMDTHMRLDENPWDSYNRSLYAQCLEANKDEYQQYSSPNRPNLEANKDEYQQYSSPNQPNLCERHLTNAERQALREEQ